MITRDASAFFAYAARLPTDASQACARAVFLVQPTGFRLAEQSAQDNRYMRMQERVDAELAARQHRDLATAMVEELPVQVFAGALDTPDAVFPNNVFATAPGRYLIGHMKHAVRQREAEREDIAAWFEAQSRERVDLRAQKGVCELTGSAVIDRARGVAYIGLSERCDEVGARAMHTAFGLRASLIFDLAPGEYHANVVLAVLAGRAALIAPSGFVDPNIPEAIATFYAPHAIRVDEAGKRDFIANAISVRTDSVWMSDRAAQALSTEQAKALAEAGLRLRSVDLSELEKAGGSLRCCIGELY